MYSYWGYSPWKNSATFCMTMLMNLLRRGNQSWTRLAHLDLNLFHLTKNLGLTTAHSSNLNDSHSGGMSGWVLFFFENVILLSLCLFSMSWQKWFCMYLVVDLMWWICLSDPQQKHKKNKIMYSMSSFRMKKGIF